MQLLGEPAPTPYDWRFQLMGIPVQVHPFFWVIPVVLGMRNPPSILILWAVVLFVSILVHEMGHALTMRYFGFQPRVVLYSLGGLAIPDSAGYGSQPRVGPRERILYTLAGPGAGFAFAALVMLVITVANWQVRFDLRNFPNFWHITMPAGQSELTGNLVGMLLYVNIFWGLMNLLPVFPLDGGQIAREILTLQDPWKGTAKSLWLSVYVGGATAVYCGFMMDRMFVALMFGVLAYSSYEMLQRGGFR